MLLRQHVRTFQSMTQIWNKSSIRCFATTSNPPTSTSTSTSTSKRTKPTFPLVKDDDNKYILGTYARFPRYIVKGKGAYIWDGEGKRYLDFNSGIAVNSIGHVHPKWLKAILKQAPQICHISNLFYSQPQIDLAKRLVTNSSFDKAFFCNSGTEANEACLKFARKYSYIHHQQTSPDKPYTKYKIIAFNGGFHGRTMGALTMTYKQAYKAPFGPLLPGVSFVNYNDIAAAEAAIDDDVCAVIVEPIQGEGGVNVATKEFLMALRRRTLEKRALLIFDEVQCGLGRAGSLWAHTTFGVEPDLMSLAKPLAGGLPIGAVLLKQHVADVMKPGDHGTTFAGGALIGKAAIATFDIINHPDFLQHVRDMGTYLVQQFEKLRDELKLQNNSQRALITDIRYPPAGGLLVGIELNIPVTRLINLCAENGVLLISAGENVIRLAPPLIINKKHVNECVKTIRKIVMKYTIEELKQA